MEFDLTIPIQPYLKKYLSSIVEIEPLTLSNDKCHISAIIFETFKKQAEEEDESQNYDTKLKALTDRLFLRFNKDVWILGRGYIDERYFLTIDKRLKAMFDQQLCDYVTIHNKKIGDIQKSIAQFMEHYKISEDDLAAHTVYKMYSRAKHTKPKKTAQQMEKVIQKSFDLFS